MSRTPFLWFLLLGLAWPVQAQQPAALATATGASPAAATPGTSPAIPRPASVAGDTGFTPSWETQKHARTYILGIPAPRGQITDRNGEPLAVTRVSYNLAVVFPTPLTMTDAQVPAFVQQQLGVARGILGRSISLNSEQVLKHYHNRGVLPFVIAQDLRPAELEAYQREQPANLTLQPVYLRFYPNGALGAHILGYAGHAGRIPDGPIENNELLWPNAEGRAGLEQAFDSQLQGKVGQYNISFDATGKRASEQISIPPQPGLNVVTTIDLNIQRLCEEALEKGCKRGAMVVVDPGSGDILAMASWPTFNPNLFVPRISPEQFKQLNDDPSIPLLPRAFGSSYPPGSTFKVIVGLAALQSGLVKSDDEFSCPPALEIGRITFRNWKHTDSGRLNFVSALTQSCDTWFYQVGIKIGAKPIVSYSQQLGLGHKTGIPLSGEADGVIPSDEYLAKRHLPKLLSGDLANLSIGQGYMEVTPLQLAEAMGSVGNGGTVFQTRLVQQVQGVDGQVVNPYNIRMRQQVDIDRAVMKNIRRGMVDVVSSGGGTAHQAQVKNVEIAGKTGTAQWGPKNRERTAAWFAGFAPADNPRYAFAVVYEGDAGLSDIHGGTFAAPIAGKVMGALFKNEKPQARKHRHDDDADDDSSGDDHSDDEAPVHHSRPEQPAPTPPPAPKKVPFWKRLFG